MAAATEQDAVRLLETSPLRFEPASDQNSDRFVARGARHLFSFTAREAVLETSGQAVRLKFQGASPAAKIEPADKLESTTGLFFGNDESKWRPEIPNYGRLQVSSLYRGIDLVYYGNAGEIEYDLQVKPGSDPRQIRLRIEGSQAHLDREGNLVAGLIQKRPIAYQLAADGAKIHVESRYAKNSDGSYGFALGPYDRRRELVIDPSFSFSLYLSGGSQDIAQAIGVDKSGFLYVAGTTFSTKFPLTSAPIQSTNAGGTDIFFSKINPSAPAGKRVVYSTYLGGTANDTLGGMAVSANGDVYLTGTTGSSGFPTKNPAQAALSGISDAFVLWINTSKALAYGTFLGGTLSETGVGITFSSKGKIYVTGGTESTDLPTAGPFQSSNGGHQDVYVAEYDPSASGSATLVFCSYLGGQGTDIGRGIAVASDNTVWVAGATYSHNFPHKGNSYKSTYNNFGDAFFAHINPSAGSSGLEYSSYLGANNYEEATSLLLDLEGRVVISGWTLSSNFPVTADALQTTYAGNTDAFVSIFDPTKSDRASQLVYSTYFGGNGGDVPTDMKLDSAGNLYLSGYTLSPGLPTTENAVQKAWDGSMDAFALRFNPATAGAAAINYLTYLGSDGLQVANGIAFDTKDDIYIVGYTSGPIFKANHGTTKPSAAGNIDAFIAGLNAKP